MVSNVIGQGKLAEVLPTIKKIGFVSFIMIVPLCILINVFPHLFYAMFNASPDFVNDAIPVMRTVSLAIILMSQGSVWLNAISGTGLTKITLSIEILTVMVYVIYVYFAVQIKTNTLVWAWASEFFYWGIILICALVFFHQYNWKSKVQAQI